MQKCDANLSEEEIQNWTKFNNDSEDPGRIGFAELQSEYYKWYKHENIKIKNKEGFIINDDMKKYMEGHATLQ